MALVVDKLPSDVQAAVAAGGTVVAILASGSPEFDYVWLRLSTGVVQKWKVMA